MAFERLGLRVIYDLRGGSERDEEPSPVASVHLSLLADDRNPASGTTLPDVGALIDRTGGERFLRDLYVGMLADGGDLFGRILTGLTAPDGLPALFHCKGGKDRTGVTAALLLLLLGVEEDAVLDDYELTDRFRPPERLESTLARLLRGGMAPEAAAGIAAAPRWAMAEALEVLRTEHGGVERYVRERAGLDEGVVEDLRRLLVVR